MEIEVELGFVVEKLNRLVEKYRKEMRYVSKLERTGWFSSKQVPVDDNFTVWLAMCKTYPWNKLAGIYVVAAHTDPKTKVWIDCAVLGQIMSNLKEYKL